SGKGLLKTAKQSFETLRSQAGLGTRVRHAVSSYCIRVTARPGRDKARQKQRFCLISSAICSTAIAPLLDREMVMNSVPNPKPTAPTQGQELQSSHELQAREEPIPVSLLGQPQIRRPERLTPRQWIWKAAGFLLMGMGGVALAVFALMYLTLL